MRKLTLGATPEGSFESFSGALYQGNNLVFELSGNSGFMTEGWKLTFLIQMEVGARIIG